MKTVCTSNTNFSQTLLIVPEEHKFALKFKDDTLNSDHAALSKQYKANLKKGSSPLIPENRCSEKLFQS